MRVVLFFFLCFFSALVAAQPGKFPTQDSLYGIDSAPATQGISSREPGSTLSDTTAPPRLQPVQPQAGRFGHTPPMQPYKAPTKDLAFFLLLFHLILLGLLRVVFPKYYATLFRVFTKTAIRQKALREQMTQNKLATLLANVYFCLSAGAFVFLVFRYHNIIPEGYAGWQLLTGAILLVGVVYACKYLFTAFGGWILGWKEMSDTYNFLVFLLNKMAGIALVPVLVMMALGNPYQQQVLYCWVLFLLTALWLPFQWPTASFAEWEFIFSYTFAPSKSFRFWFCVRCF